MKLRTYNTSEAELDRIFALQEGVCAICLKPHEDGSRQTVLAVDHCHSTGEIRGYLCIQCNVGLGAFRDSPELLKIAAIYVEQAGFV